MVIKLSNLLEVQESVTELGFLCRDGWHGPTSPGLLSSCSLGHTPHKWLAVPRFITEYPWTALTVASSVLVTCIQSNSSNVYSMADGKWHGTTEKNTFSTDRQFQCTFGHKYFTGYDGRHSASFEEERKITARFMPCQEI